MGRHSFQRLFKENFWWHYDSTTIIIWLFWEFFSPALADGFHRSLSDIKSSQLFRILLRILAGFVVWMVSTRFLIFKSSSPWSNLSVTVPRGPVTIGITVPFVFHSFASSLTRSRYWSLFTFLQFLYSARTPNYTIRQVLLSLLTITRSGRLAKIRWSVCISKSQRSLWVSFSKRDSGLCLNHWLNCQILIFCTIPSSSPSPSRMDYRLWI